MYSYLLFGRWESRGLKKAHSKNNYAVNSYEALYFSKFWVIVLCCRDSLSLPKKPLFAGFVKGTWMRAQRSVHIAPGGTGLCWELGKKGKCSRLGVISPCSIVFEDRTLWRPRFLNWNPAYQVIWRHPCQSKWIEHILSNNVFNIYIYGLWVSISSLPRSPQMLAANLSLGKFAMLSHVKREALYPGRGLSLNSLIRKSWGDGS